jgi:hypothetical protein
MREFKSWRDFGIFENATKYQSRYIHSPEVKAFLDTVLQTAEKQIEHLSKDRILWRTRLDHNWEPISEEGEFLGNIPSPLLPEQMKPLKDKAREGRANPKGIPYLYLATDCDTAIAEVRPWIGSYISVGQFKMTRELRLVNCTNEHQGSMLYLNEPSAEEREKCVWADIDRAFARPVSPCDDIADYVPTQIIAELFKANNFDGIAYRSSLGKGHNVALFNLDAAKLINPLYLFQVDKINVESHEVMNLFYPRKEMI